MSKSVISKASNASSKMLEEIANRSQTKYKKCNLGSIVLREASVMKKCV
jgi:hypothetical protein